MFFSVSTWKYGATKITDEFPCWAQIKKTTASGSPLQISVKNLQSRWKYFVFCLWWEWSINAGWGFCTLTLQGMNSFSSINKHMEQNDDQNQERCVFWGKYCLKKKDGTFPCSGVCPSSMLIIQALSVSRKIIYTGTTHVPAHYFFPVLRNHRFFWFEKYFLC